MCRCAEISTDRQQVFRIARFQSYARKRAASSLKMRTAALFFAVPDFVPQASSVPQARVTSMHDAIDVVALFTAASASDTPSSTDTIWRRIDRFPVGR
jgi:hypothetical protein